MLAGDAGQTALLLLDSPHLDQSQIETMLAAQTPARAPEITLPAPETQASPPNPITPQISQAAAEPCAPDRYRNRPAKISVFARAASTPTPPPPLHGLHANTPFRPPRFG